MIIPDVYWNCRCGASYENHRPKECGCGRGGIMKPTLKPTGDYIVMRMLDGSR